MEPWRCLARETKLTRRAVVMERNPAPSIVTWSAAEELHAFMLPAYINEMLERLQCSALPRPPLSVVWSETTSGTTLATMQVWIWHPGDSGNCLEDGSHS